MESSLEAQAEPELEPERKPQKFHCQGEVVEVVGDKKNSNNNLKSSFKPNFMNKREEYR